MDALNCAGMSCP